MKKVFLSGAVVLAFVLYGLHQRDEGSSIQVTTPTGLSSAPTNSPVTGTATSPAPGKYKDGTYTGRVADAYYGTIQVQAVIQGGRITAVKFLQYPNDRSTSIRINTEAMPYLEQEAIQAQSAQVDGVSGASDSSQAFIQSLSDALNQAS